MTSLNQKPPCNCCSTVRDHIAQHYDPDATLQGNEDPLEILESFKDFEGGCDLSYRNITDYLDEIRMARSQSGDAPA